MNAYLKKFLIRGIGDDACPAIQRGWEKVSLPELSYYKSLSVYVYDYFQSAKIEIKEILLALFAFITYHVVLYVVTIDFVLIDRFVYRAAIYLVTFSVLLFGARYAYLRRSKRENLTDKIFKSFLSQRAELCAAFPGIVQKCNSCSTLQEVMFDRLVELAGEVLEAEARAKAKGIIRQWLKCSNNVALARISVLNALTIAKYFVDFGNRKIVDEAFRMARSK